MDASNLRALLADVSDGGLLGRHRAASPVTGVDIMVMSGDTPSMLIETKGLPRPPRVDRPHVMTTILWIPRRRLVRTNIRGRQARAVSRRARTCRRGAPPGTRTRTARPRRGKASTGGPADLWRLA
jgi:hypothetical protein